MAEPTIVHVPLGERAYDIVIGPDLLESAGPRLKAMFPGRRFGIVTDSEVAKAQMPRLAASLDAAGLKHSAVVVPNGESTKSIARLNDVVEGLLEARLERSKTASTLTEANALFEQGRVAEANKKLADQASELKATATVARAAAKAKGEKDDALAGDFDKQLAAVSTAESNFAAAPEARAMATTAPMASGAFPADAQGFGRGSAGGGSFAHAPAVAAASPRSCTGSRGRTPQHQEPCL